MEATENLARRQDRHMRKFTGDFDTYSKERDAPRALNPDYLEELEESVRRSFVPISGFFVILAAFSFEGKRGPLTSLLRESGWGFGQMLSLLFL